MAMCAGDAMKRSGPAQTADLAVISTTGELTCAGKTRPTGAATPWRRCWRRSSRSRRPPELRALTVPAGETSGADGLDVLMSALAYYERPNRQADVAALAERAHRADRRLACSARPPTV